jgi:hypothetical protein
MMPEPCRGLPVHPAARPGTRAARRGGCCISAGEALKLLARLEDLNVLADEEGQTEQKGLQDLHLTEMASWRQGDRTQRPPGAPGRWKPRLPGRRPG